jgi:heme exporter protein CcmD
MSHWPYIVASYALTLGGMAGLVAFSWWRMRNAEAEAEAVRRK